MKAFLSAMAEMGSLVVHTFLFPATSGRASHTVQVVAARKEGLDEDGMEERRMKAYELATVTKEERTSGHRSTKEEPPSDDSKRPHSEVPDSLVDEEEERKEGEGGDEEAEVEEVDVASDDGSEVSVAVRRPLISDPEAGLTDARVLFGFIRPIAARAQYLHQQLWTAYQKDDNRVVSSPSPGAPLSFSYSELVKRLYLRDYLLVSGLPYKSQQEPPFMRDHSLLDVPLDRLPLDVQRFIDEQEMRYSFRFKCLHGALELLCQLHLIEPLVEGMKASSQLSKTFTGLHSQYTLTPSFTGAVQFNFSSPAALTQYWDALRDAATKGVEVFDLPSLTSEWRVSPVVLSRLRKAKCWKYRLSISEEEVAQLRDLDKAVRESNSASMLSVTQVVRAANLASTTAAAAATLYSRDHFPQLAAVHDSVQAFQLMLRKTRRLKDPHEAKKKRRTHKEMAELKEKEKAEQGPLDTSAHTTAGDSAFKSDRPRRGPRRRRAVVADTEGDGTGEESAEAPPAKPRRRAAKGVSGSRRSRRTELLWTPKEEGELIELYNEWLEAQRQSHRLPFTFTPPPHVDVIQDDALPFAFSAPSTSSSSPFVASFHTLLPLMWLDHPKASRPLSHDGGGEEKEEWLPARDSASSDILRARREFVLHRQPLPKEANISVEQLFKPVNPRPAPTPGTPPIFPVHADEDEDDRRSEHSREDEEKEMKVDEEGGADERKTEVAKRTSDRPLRFDSSSALLFPFYNFAESRLSGRSGGVVRHRFDLYRSRLHLPVGLSSSTRCNPILFTPYTSAHLAHDPLLMALCALVKSIVLQPEESYSSQQAHLCTRHFSQAQVQLVIAALRGDRLIRPRKGNKGGAERGWTLTAAATELLYGKKDERESRQAVERWTEEWKDTPHGQLVELRVPLKTSEADAVLERVAQLDFDVVTAPVQEEKKPEDEEAAEAMQEVQVEEMEEVKEDSEAMEVEAKEEVKEESGGMEEEQKVGVEDCHGGAPPKKKRVKTARGHLIHNVVKETALRAAVADLNGVSVTLLSTTWPAIHRADSHADVSTTSEGHSSDLRAADSSLDQSELRSPSSEAAMEDVAEEEKGSEDSSTPFVQLLRMQSERAAVQDSDADDDDFLDLADRVERVLTVAGPAGLALDEIAAQVEEDSLLVQQTLPIALRHLRVFRVFSYDHERFIAREFADRWTFPDSRDAATRRREEEQWRQMCGVVRGTDDEGEVVSSVGDEEVGSEGSAVMAHPWRLMSGEVNREVWDSLYESMLKCVREWPGVKEDRLMDMHPVLTPMEFAHIVGTLLLDDVICKRTWRQTRAKKSSHLGRGTEERARAEGEGAGDGEQEEVITCYFPLHLCV